jgi:hypothetical protein
MTEIDIASVWMISTTGADTVRYIVAGHDSPGTHFLMHQITSWYMAHTQILQDIYSPHSLILTMEETLIMVALQEDMLLGLDLEQSAGAANFRPLLPYPPQKLNTL